MGWTFCNAWQTKAACVADIVSGQTVLAQRSTGKGFYAVIEDSKGRFILTCLVKRAGGSYGFKGMDEGMGPYGLDDCPLAFFELVPVAPNAEAQAWRDRVRTWHAAKRAARIARGK